LQVVDAERRVEPAKQRKHLLVVPAHVTELNGRLYIVWKQGQEPFQARIIPVQAGRQLEEQRAKGWPEELHAI
jgi:Ser/Thr protein kinase RdoA (MazF antagonist)